MKIEIITNADNNPVAEFFSSSNTPETNEAQHEGLLRGNSMPTQVVHVNFARKLERERDEAREAWYVMQSSFERSRDEVEKLIRERDEAFDLLASEKITRNHIIKRSVEVEKERDEAREVFREMWQSGDAFLPHVDQATTNRWRKAAGWEETK